MFEMNTFKECFTEIALFPLDVQARDPAWYQALTQCLDEEQRKQLQDIATLADQRRAAHGEANSCLSN